MLWDMIRRMEVTAKGAVEHAVRSAKGGSTAKLQIVL